MSSSPDRPVGATAGVIEEIPRRTRLVAVIALAVGGALLGVTLHAGDASTLFYVSGFTLAGWWALAAFVAPTYGRRAAQLLDVAVGGVAGAIAFGAFVAAFELARNVEPLASEVGALLDTADRSGLGPVVVLALANGITEELFFRGTLVDAVRRSHRWIAGVVPYVLITVPSANGALVAAAAVMGAVFTGLRLARRTVVAPIACHLTWSMLMLVAFPRP